MRAGVRSYFKSVYESARTRNFSGLRPKILSYYHNILRLESGARLIVDERLHLATRHNVFPSACYLELGHDSLMHVQGRASFRGEARVVLSPHARLIIGNHVILRERLWLRVHEQVTIGNGSGIGQDSMIIDSDVHAIVTDGVRQPTQAPITIGDNVWVGAHCIILKGVTIGSSSIIGAGSLVSRDIPDHVLAVGRPARPIRKIDFGIRDAAINLRARMLDALAEDESHPQCHTPIGNVP